MKISLQVCAIPLVYITFIIFGTLAGTAFAAPSPEASISTPTKNASPSASGSRLYEFRSDHDPDGSGKFFQGREISLVMGHQGSEWLERPERETEERPDILIDNLPIKSGASVADIGAGTGYMSWRLAKRVGAKGRIYAVDIQQEMLDQLQQKMAGLKIENVTSILGTEDDPKLPAGALDLVLMVDVYHEFSQPYEMLQRICAGLKPGGQLVFVEYRGEDPAVPIKRLHKMSETQVKKEAALHPLEWIKTINALPRQHMIVFAKKRQ